MTARSLNRLLLAFALLLGLTSWSDRAEAQQPDMRRSELRTAIGSLEAAIPSRSNDFKGLLVLRDRAEGLIAEARALRSESEATRDEVKQQAANGVAGADGLVAEAEAQFREDTRLARDAEAAWNTITELRRKLFSGHLFSYSLSPLSPTFWSELIQKGLPLIGDKMRTFAESWRSHVDENEATTDVVIMVIVAAGLLAGILILRRISHRLLARWRRFAVFSGVAPRRAAAIGALLELAFGTIPIPLALSLLAFVNEELDFAPPQFDGFLKTLVLAVVGVLLGSGILSAVMSPHDPRLRLVSVSQSAALVVYRTGTAMILVFATEIVFSSFAGIVHFMVILSEFSTVLMVLACITLMILGLAGLARADDDADATPAGIAVRGFVWLTPFAWIIAGFCLLCVIAGFTSLGAFVMGRFIVTAVLAAFAWLLLICIDALFVSAAEVAAAPRLQRLCRTLAVSPETLAIVSIGLSGLLRLMVLVALAFVLVGPWHLEYGEMNPFQDAFLGFNLSELRNLLGSAGFACLTFFVGVAGTRIATGWLDRQLLPQTRLDAGARYSIITVVGYGGLALTLILALGQLGVNPQSLTVIAGALSVGIGFGLQSIVSNFVSGLIVLAERPIRVGDLVTVKGEEGRVKRISVRSTLIATGDRTDLIVPNTDLITSIVRNKTLTDDTQRLRVPMVLDRDVDGQVLQDIVIGVARRHPNVAATPEPTILLVKLGETGLEYEARCFLVDGGASDATRSELNGVWLALFRKAGIKLAAPAVA
ncbi:DUF3772 domain-containing protein [Methylobacterium brachythecii]|uniref:Mechanosensitive ion channel protein MscS n=1 Tax=Methylobacterium brachythecii TaxID=1176177 RepID=A0A7W6AEN9_9HYPH|nr:DUF3772 domain-containing protein [Methylobacterium brachythecii]MBB3901915.1 small-conductance mechanosensitive channel [Methylobacterium brachythecii]GLS43295.1 mechanosensitive ion channel protein MscS [Methylobacterium brachythecii]